MNTDGTLARPPVWTGANAGSACICDPSHPCASVFQLSWSRAAHTREVGKATPSCDTAPPSSRGARQIALFARVGWSGRSHAFRRGLRRFIGLAMQMSAERTEKEAMALRAEVSGTTALPDVLRRPQGHLSARSALNRPAADRTGRAKSGPRSHLGHHGACRLRLCRGRLPNAQCYILKRQGIAFKSLRCLRVRLASLLPRDQHDPAARWAEFSSPIPLAASLPRGPQTASPLSRMLCPLNRARQGIAC
jgi:hypothetical protein